MSGPGPRVGIDVGGTFTDVVTIADGEVTVSKVPSTPTSPDAGVDDGLDAVGIDDGHVGFIAHGTTVATNAVLEGTWAQTALVTTAGFRDVLEIGRQARPAMYDLQAEKPRPIVSRDRRFEVDERVDERGTVEIPLSTASIEAVCDSVETADAEAVAVCLLFSFENANHERRIADALAGLDVAVSRSSEVLPEIREFERTLATALNAGLIPVIDRYLGRLSGRLEERSIQAPLRIMQSNGGIIGVDQARVAPVNTLLSGPAAGVTGAAHVAGLAGLDDVITMDMGGTSCDVSLVANREPLVSTEVAVGDYAVGVPMIDIHTIGAGGGSIAWIDGGDALRVGPQSAGADPGPICYGRGGTEPTITDAHAVLDRIDPATFLAEGLSPAIGAASDGIASRIAEPLGLDVEAAAAGILEVADANMVRAVRVVSVERGHDPRDFALVAFGGAGPLHAPGIARTLEIPQVAVPPAAGVLSALGLLVSDLVHEFSTSRVRRLSETDPAELHARLVAFGATGRDRLAEEGVAAERIDIDRSMELRYVGQSSTLRIPAPADLDEPAMATIADRFHEAHAARYGHATRTEPIELVTLRLRAIGRVDPPDLRAGDGPRRSSPRTTRSVWLDGARRDTAVFDRPTLRPGATIDGPAIVEGRGSTALIPADQTARIDGHGTMLIEIGGGS